MGDTVQRPGGDAAVVRVHGTSKGLAVTCDVTPRYVLADPVDGHQAGRGRDLAQPDRRRRRSARHHRQHELRQPRAARDHGPVRRRHRRAWRRPARRSSTRSCPATSRSTTRPTASPSRRRRRSAASGLVPDIAQHGRHSPSRPRATCWSLIGREAGPPRPVALPADRHRQDRGRAAAGRPGRRDQGRQPGARADPRGQGRAPCTTSATAACWSPSPRWRWPAASACSSSPTRASCRRTPPGSARTRAATCWRPRPELAEEIIERARLLALPARVVGRVGGDALALKGEAALALADLRPAHEAWLPSSWLP